MLDFFSSVLSVVVVFGTIVVVHELGHFWAAKIFNIKVNAFAVGFGPKILGFRKGETEYKICAIPLGGYVSMAGENPEDATGGVEEFLSHPKWQRFIVAIMGPVMNFLLAVALLTGLYYHHYEVPLWPREPVVIGLVKAGSVAENNLKPNDKILQINELKDPTWEDFLFEVRSSPEKSLKLQVKRGEQIFSTTVIPETRGKEHVGFLGALPFELASVWIGDVLPEKPAYQAGILPGDQVIKVAGVELRKIGLDLIDSLNGNKDKTIAMTVLRNNEEIDLNVTPYLDETQQRRMIGVSLYSRPRTTTKDLSFTESIKTSFEQNYKFAGLIFNFLNRLVQGQISMRMVGGPIEIAKQSSMAAKSSLNDFIFLIAAISLNLGIVNLLPIPILDGGVITIILIESIFRHDLSLKVRERVAQVGFAMVILLVIVVTYNDIIKLLPISTLEKYFP